MRTADLFPLWCWIDDQEQAGRISGNNAIQAKIQIYVAMWDRGLAPDDVIPGHSLADTVAMNL